MVVLAGQRVIGIHGLRLAPYVDRLCIGKGLVVAGTDLPEGNLTGYIAIEPLSEDEQRVIAFSEGMAEVGAGTCAVVAVMHLTVAEMEHEVLFVNHMDTQKAGGMGWKDRDQHQS